ncbi:MAG: hypothetical protein AAF915_01880 [Cyanobacteria bacterium P01_D01_bin.50]
MKHFDKFLTIIIAIAYTAIQETCFRTTLLAVMVLLGLALIFQFI